MTATQQNLKKLIIIARKEYLRNYIQTNAFALIDDENTFYALPAGSSAPMIENSKQFAGFFTYTPQ